MDLCGEKKKMEKTFKNTPKTHEKTGQKPVFDQYLQSKSVLGTMNSKTLCWTLSGISGTHCTVAAHSGMVLDVIYPIYFKYFMGFSKTVIYLGI